MSERDDTLYLRHILAAISRIEEYLEGTDKTVFSQNHLLQDGIIRQLQIIGEATSRVSPQLRQRYPQVPWSDIVGMRHKIIHDYFGVDLDVVWTAAGRNYRNSRETFSTSWRTGRLHNWEGFGVRSLWAVLY